MYALSRPRSTIDRIYGRDATLLAIALLTVGLGTVGTNALLADHLGEVDRDATATLFAALRFCLAPLEAIVVVTAGRAARGDGAMSWRRWAVKTSSGGALVAIVTGSLFVLTRRTDAVATAVALVAVLPTMAAGVVPRGVLLGVGRFAPVAGALFSGATTRIVIVFASLSMGAGLMGTVVALLSGEAVTTLVLWRAARSAAPPADKASLPVTRGERVIEPLVAFVAMFALGMLPTMLAHRYLGGWAREHFIAAHEATRILLFLPQAIAALALARFARGGTGAVEALRMSLRVAAGSSLLVTFALALLDPSLVQTAVMHANGVPVPLLILLGLSTCTLGLLGILVTYHVARGLPCAGTVVFALVGAVAFSLLWHPSFAAFSAAVVIAGLVALARLLAGPALLGPAAPWPDAERRRGPESGAGLVDLSVIVPFYNPGEALRANVTALIDTLEREGVDFEIIAVSDGSTDGSERLVEDLGGRVRALVLTCNRGKGAALCAGLEVARGRYLGFIDADGDIPPELWHSFLTLMDLYDADMIVGSKRHSLSEVHYPPIRRVYSRVYQALVHLLFRIDVTDTQTGIKLFRRDVLVDVLPLTREEGFVFDLELLLIARRCRWRRVIEAPVRVQHQFRSTVSLRSAVQMLGQTLLLAVRLHVLRSYDVPATVPGGEQRGELGTEQRGVLVANVS